MMRLNLGAMPIAMLSAACASAAMAQDTSGRWSGRMEPTDLSAVIELSLQRAELSWTGELTLRPGPDKGVLSIEELRVVGDSLLVRTKIEGADVRLELVHQEELLLGSVRVTVIEAAGAASLSEKEVFPLPDTAIHSVTNPIGRLTGAIHIYGGDFFAKGRSEWDAETLRERPFDLEAARRVFDEANKRFQAGH